MILLASVKSKLEGIEFQDVMKEVETFAKKPLRSAFLATYSDFYVGYAQIEYSKVSPVKSLQDKLSTYSHAIINVSKGVEDEGLEQKLLGNVEKWAEKNNSRGVWTSFKINDKKSEKMYKQSGYKMIGAYTDSEGLGRMIAAREFIKSK